MSRTLALIARARGLAVAEARRDLAARLAEADAATGAVAAAAAAIAAERGAATRMDAGDGSVEAFAAWLPRGTAALDARRDAQARAEAASDQARARLTVARSAEAAIDSLIARKAAEARVEGLKREQQVLDEIALRK